MYFRVLKKQIRSWSQSKNSALYSTYIIIIRTRQFFKFFIKAEYRAQVIYSFFYRKDYLQKPTTTYENRYPQLFQICQQHFENKRSLKILSFGCSTGEEVKSISSFFPKAIIIGTDINKHSLRIARKNYSAKNISFMHVLSKVFKELDQINIIFCCAVFQDPRNRNDLNNNIAKNSFQQFDKWIKDLDNKLLSKGALIIDHCDFNFLDTQTSLNYTPLDVNNNRIERDRPYYNKNNKKVCDITNNYRVFIKN